jgi:5'-nucleotidase
LIRFSIVIACVLFVWVGGTLASSLTILYTNDLHTRLGRLEGLAELIERERAIDRPVLLLDAGDTWQDFRIPLYAAWGAEEMVDWMNRVSYDAMALGNHDLYWGADQLAALCERARFSVLCANLRPSAGITPPFTRYTTISIGELNVLVVGLITSDYLPYPDFPWLRYAPPTKALQNVLDTVSERADLIVAVGHLPVEEAARIVQSVPGVDVFLTGHSHEMTVEPVQVGKTLIVQAGEFGQFLGRLRLELDSESGDILSATNELLPTEKSPTRLGRGYLRLFQVCVLIGCLFLFCLI